MPTKAKSTAVAVATPAATPAPKAQYLVRTLKPFTSKVKHNQDAVASIMAAIAKGVTYAQMCNAKTTPIKGGRPGTQHTVARYMVNKLKLFTVTTNAPK